MSDKEDLTLRDQLAIAALLALIDRFTKRNERGWITNGGVTDDFKTHSADIATLAYGIADAFRKARLRSFT